MRKNSVCGALYLRNHKWFDFWFLFMVLMFKIIRLPGVKIAQNNKKLSAALDISGRVRNGPKWPKKYVSLCITVPHMIVVFGTHV